MCFWILLLLTAADKSPDDVLPLIIPLEITLELINDPGTIQVTQHDTITDFFTTTSSIDFRLKVKNPLPEPISIDLEDTPLDVTLMDGILPADYFSAESDVIWADIESEFIENDRDTQDIILNCASIPSDGELVVEFTLGPDKNKFGFTKSSGSANIAFTFEVKECVENAHNGREVHITTNSISLVLEPSEIEVGGWGDKWVDRGHVETDDDGVFYWVDTHNDPGRTWTHPSIPRTISFSSGDNYEDCHDSVTYNGVTKTLQEWIIGLEEDKQQFCAATIYHMQQRTPEFDELFKYYFGDFTEDKFDELKGKVARICSADGYEYNCNPTGTCNTGLMYRYCVSVNPPYEYGQKCFNDIHPEIRTIHQSEIVNLDLHKDMDLPTLRQEMITCSLDKRNCDEGNIPSLKGGVKAYVASLVDSGVRTINLCPIGLWMGYGKMHCRLSDIKDQIDPGTVYEFDRAKACWTSPTETLFHELAHFSDIANAGHTGQLDNTYALSGFLAGIGEKPPPPTVSPTTSEPTHEPTILPSTSPTQPTSRPTLKPTTAGACEDGKHCSSYKTYIDRNPGFYCDNGGYFGVGGYYCTRYKNNNFCCPVSCGQCTENEEIELAAQERPEYAKYGGYPLQEYWTTPEWMEITWDSFPIDPQVDATLLEETNSFAFGKTFKESPFTFALAVFGFTAMVLSTPCFLKSFCEQDAYTRVFDPEV